MSEQILADGVAVVGGKPVPLASRVIRERFRMQVPEEFSEDANLVSNYTYLFSRDKSPLSIAIKYTSAAAPEERERQIAHYFSQAPETLESITRESGGVFYRETVTGSQYISVYSLRFAVEVLGGLLFGCFNCSAQYKDDWRGVVLAMLQGIEEIS